MESPFEGGLRGLSAGISRLASQRDEALEALEQAREEISDLRQKLREAEKELHRKYLDVEYLTVSHKLADSPQALAEARATVKKMIAAVEKTISLLRADAGI